MAQGQGARPRRGGAEGVKSPLSKITTSLAERAAAILAASEPAEKIALSRKLAAHWRTGVMRIGCASPPSRPARPDRPALCLPRGMPRRRNFGSRASRIALIHALAHIELNAIDLAWDVIARFAEPETPLEFCDDWVRVAAEESEHFGLLADRLAALGAFYGDLPAHDGLWEAAEATAHDLLARLAVVPLVLEARGLDVTPAMMRRLERAGDAASAGILHRIYEDEIGHVTVGVRWFAQLCRQRGFDPQAVFHDRVRQCFNGVLKPPFNREARDSAGFPAAYYEPLASVRVADPP